MSQLLRFDIDEFAAEARKTNPLLRRARSGQLPPETIGRYLRSIHYLLLHTPVHLSLAEGRARMVGREDLAEYYALKKAEEEGHDRWAASDIENLARAFRVRVPDEPIPAMRLVVEANAEEIRKDPCNYLAYVLFAEYLMIVLGPEWLSALADNCGIPNHFMTAISKHVELDKVHVDEGCGEIDALVGWDQLGAMRIALRGTMQRFSAFCEALCEA